MRLYTFTNFYLSSIQQGIQSAHCLHEMFVKYQMTSGSELLNLYAWAKNHKTMIVLNGGDSLSLREVHNELIPLANKLGLPLATFSEDERSLNNAMTCVGIVVPEIIYEIDIKAIDSFKAMNGGWLMDQEDSDEVALKRIISRYSLAR